MAGQNAPSRRESDPADKTEATRETSPSAHTDDLLMAEVNLTRSALASNRGPGKACELAMQQYLDTSPDIFKVRSGEFRGMKVPEAVRCATFQSNIAERAGLIRPGEVTVRALEFGELMQRKGYAVQNFKPGVHYPDGTYIVGEGARDGTNSRHVGMICEGRLLHTGAGKVRNQAIGEKFFPGAYDSIKVYIPPRGHRQSARETNILEA